MKRLIYPGSFDPFTLGHFDIASRAAQLCDELVVVIIRNNVKDYVFSVEERVEMAQNALKCYKNVTVISYTDLLINCYKKFKANAVVKGLRSESDFRYESEMASVNKVLLKDFETCLLICRPDLAYLSSTIVREICTYGGDIQNMVPTENLERIKAKFAELNK